MRLCRNNAHDKDVVGATKRGECKACAKASNRRWLDTEKGKTRRRASFRRWKLRSEEHLKEKWREQHANNREKRIEQMRARRRKIRSQYGSEANYFWAMQVKESL